MRAELVSGNDRQPIGASLRNFYLNLHLGCQTGKLASVCPSLLSKDSLLTTSRCLWGISASREPCLVENNAQNGTHSGDMRSSAYARTTIEAHMHGVLKRPPQSFHNTITWSPLNSFCSGFLLLSRRHFARQNAFILQYRALSRIAWGANAFPMFPL